MKRLLAILIAAALSSSPAAAGSAIYQYKDARDNLFNILMWSVCGAPNQYCTGMVLEDASGAPLSAAPGTAAPPSGLQVGGMYNSLSPSPQPGQFEPLQLDNAGRLIINCVAGCSSAPSLSHASTTALASSLLVKASAGNLSSFNCTALTGGAAGYCIAYNAPAAPAAGPLTGSLVLDQCYFDTTPRGCSLAHIGGPIGFSAGIVILVTSAASPYTYTTSTDTASIEADFN